MGIKNPKQKNKLDVEDKVNGVVNQKKDLWRTKLGEKVESTELKSVKRKAFIIPLLATLVVLFVAFYGAMCPLNIRSVGLWFTAWLALNTFVGTRVVVYKIASIGREKKKVVQGEKITWKVIYQKSIKIFLVPTVFTLVFILVAFSGSELFNAKSYSELLTVDEVDFADDIAPSMNTDYIALMDTASAKMLGDREIGSLSNVVSQYDVSSSYTQIDYNGKPIKVAALNYAGFFKWINNMSSGVPGYISVDPVSMSASYQSCERGMRYVQSGYFNQKADRYIWLHYPTALVESAHFEIDEQGNPYYIAPVYQKTISLLSGRTMIGAIILNPITGELKKYDLDQIPNWVDCIFDGDLICSQYDWYGTLKNGFINSIIGKKDCKQTTRYTGDDADSDTAPASDYGYVTKDGDIWIYTGITSVNGDSSNIGFLLANERTGEAHYFNVAGADEKSAMSAAEGEVQEKNYQASFPSLINVNDTPTYIMVLKDAGGLVKLYAAVSVEQYNNVVTASTQAECLEKYRALLGITEEEESKTEAETEIQTKTITIQSIKSVDIEGNTYLYFVTSEKELFKAMVYEHEDMLLLNEGDTLEIAYVGNSIASYKLK